MPRGVGREGWVCVDGDEADVGRRELAFARHAAGLAPRRQLLEVRHLAHVDLGGEMPADRLLQRLVGAELPAGECPRTLERRSGALPQKYLQTALSHPQHDRERDVRARIDHEF